MTQANTVTGLSANSTNATPAASWPAAGGPPDGSR
jgi:hypothetical protein